VCGLSILRTVARVRQRVYPLLLAAGLVGVVYLVVQDPLVGAQAVMVTATRAAPDPQTLHPLTTGSHMDGFGSWSADGSRLAFMRDGQVWVAAAGGTGAQRLSGRAVAAGPAGWDVSPVWRPDGRQIAFARLGEAGAQVKTVDPATGQETVLATETVPVGYLAWGAKGESLWYTTARTLVRVDAASGRKSLVVTLPENQEMLAGGLAVSRDGRTLVLGVGERQDQRVVYDLWTLDLSRPGEQSQRLTREGGIMPALDPKGRMLVYRNPRRGQGIYLMDFSSHRTKRLLADGSGSMFFHPAFAPDGKRVVVSRLQLGNTGEPREIRLVSHLFVAGVLPP